MKHIIIFILLNIFFQSCMNIKQDYKYKYTIEVIYQNDNIDTLFIEKDSFYGNKIQLYLNTDKNNTLDSSTINCLMYNCGFYRESIVCHVKKYKIINKNKILINKQ